MIKLGYEIGTGEEVAITPSHLVVTGVTASSGKTTTLNALAKRSGAVVVTFRTKPGEKEFSDETVVPAFYRSRNDYEFTKALIENFSRERISSERSVLMELCKGAKSIDEVFRSVNNTLANNPKLAKRDVYVRLQHYLETLIPQLKKAKLSRTLVIDSGINVMDIENLSEEIQGLVIQSTLDEILSTRKGVVVVLPEAWRFVPERGSSPCKLSVEAFIRQGATNGNYLWLDSQEMASVSKSILKQVSTWCLGYQSEVNEVKHTLAQIPLPSGSKPKPEQIMTLKVGQFYVATNEGVKKVYVQPLWLGDEEALGEAVGKECISVGGKAFGKSQTMSEVIQEARKRGVKIMCIDDIGTRKPGLKPQEVLKSLKQQDVINLDVPQTFHKNSLSDYYEKRIAGLEQRIEKLEKIIGERK